jgi:fructokinase
MSQSEFPIVVGLGELLWDCFADSRLPGGAPANVAYHACQLGCRGIVASRVGQDPLGDELVAFLASQGLETAWVQRDATHPTSTVTVDASRPDDPRFYIHENVAWDYLALEMALEQLLVRANAVCFGTLAQRSRYSCHTIQQAIRTVGPGCLVVFDVNLRQGGCPRYLLEASLRASHIVKLNAEEVLGIDEYLEIGAREPEWFARAIQDLYGVDTVCITRGDRGCVLIGPDQVADDSGKPVAVADTVGAGDAFTAALIASRLRGWPLAAQASFANAVGGLVAGRRGAMPAVGEAYRQLARRTAEEIGDFGLDLGPDEGG